MMAYVPTLGGQSSPGGTGVPIVLVLGALRQVHTRRLGGHTFQTQGGHTAPVVQRPVAVRSYVGSLQLQRIAPEFCSSLLLLLARLLTPHIA